MWSTFALSPGTTYQVRFPRANTYIHANGVFWRIATVYTDKPQRPAPAAPVKNPPKDLPWRYSALLGPAEMTIRPRLPVLPYDILIDKPVSILPSVEIDGYLFVPLQAEFSVTDGTILASVPLGPEKTSWFGSTQEGLLCEAIVSGFSTAIEVGRFLINPSPVTAICPVSIKNAMQEGMDLARLCIPTDFLSIYGRGGIYSTDRVSCYFSPDGLRVNPRRGMDPLLGNLDLQHSARKSSDVKFFSKGVDFLKYIAGL